MNLASTAVVARTGLCFAGSRRSVRCAGAAIDATGLVPDVAQALADTLPFLLCGEESAVHAFGRRLTGQAGRRAALLAIADDEARHAAWLARLAAALPVPRCAPDEVQMAGFFRGLLTREPARHFARIAALDLAVCMILRPLAGPATQLRGAPQVVTGLRMIRHDEARHVRVARDCARDLGIAAGEQRLIDSQLLHALARLLAPVRGSLDRLGVPALGRVERVSV